MDNNIKADIIFAFLFLLILANVFVWQFIFFLNNDFSITFFDVGQGDSFFIETPQGHQILIDGGPGNRVLTKLGKAMPFWDRTLDLVILTHPESDHLSGLLEVLKRYQIKNILWSGVERSAGIFEQWQEVLKEEKAKVVFAQAGQKIRAGKVSGDVLFPLKNLSGQFFDRGVNETSVVVLFNFQNNRFLFTGDIGKKEEKALLDIGCNLKADVLKVAHHGSKYSSSLEFLRAVLPQMAVISCGANNTYGHPSKEVLNSLQEFAINVLRTDQKGDIIITSDGSNFKYK
ncbi:MBL fold metallo-hydrolase [bacterium (Candidatus Gribaldobacteria) CG08_land_8_20_14_0_20_39_15]|uniref:MBL fold metallo-hydrolase n=1 Tax=bacterium (Candidatus Gribaldobacteria) CG08_land_8_20_14_0_20_39_15 TaxID=2014273 RepID=A0A2M6XUP9_9BACT|nr:MAG: MBL fold metallo-hydrolase [bacterium (Candidatus Gribaldobacteria) CG08_land_8_20_14_0_20_39_15]